MPTINNITQELQDSIKETMTALSDAYREANDIYKTYWETDANTTVSALLLSSSPATQSTKLTKAEFQAGISLVQDYIAFISNNSVSTSQRTTACHNLIYGTASPTNLNNLIESLGERLKAISEVFIFRYLGYLKLEQIYFKNEISDMLAVLDPQRVIFGASMTQADLSSAITFLGEFRDYMDNSAVTTGDYQSTLAKWELY